MPKEVNKFLTQDVDQLLENPEFRAWAHRSDVVVPAEANNLQKARMILIGLETDNGISLPTESEKDTDFVALMAKVNDLTTSPVTTTKVRRLWPGIATAAAAILLLLVAGTFLLRTPTSTIYATGNAEQRVITLSDGTIVTLNANSTLELPEGELAATERLVSLDGEAYFDVAKDADRPFLVSTDDATVRVLGTRFNVRERRGSTRIFLEEGEVRIGWPGTQLPDTRMLPNEVVTLAARGKKPVLMPVAIPSRHLAWRNGHLEFDQLSLVEALNELSDIYGVEINCADEALEKLEISSAGIPVDDLTLALQLMEKALGLRIEARESSVYQVFAAE